MTLTFGEENKSDLDLFKTTLFENKI